MLKSVLKAQGLPKSCIYGENCRKPEFGGNIDFRDLAVGYVCIRQEIGKCESSKA